MIMTISSEAEYFDRQGRTHLDTARLAELAARSEEFLNRRPFPWLSAQGVIREESFRRLYAELPTVGEFQSQLGNRRAHGQQGHDRYALQYRPALDPALSLAWREFIGELRGAQYGKFIRALYGLGAQERVVLSMHWHYAPTGASVSPHVDARRKLGSHIFYFHSEQDWDPRWGGQTLVLEDENRRFPAHSAPRFEELREVAASEMLGNRSFLFRRTEHSWHGVRPIACPDGRLRKVFIVVINRVNFQVLWRRVRGKDPDGYPL